MTANPAKWLQSCCCYIVNYLDKTSTAINVPETVPISTISTEENVNESQVEKKNNMEWKNILTNILGLILLGGISGRAIFF